MRGLTAAAAIFPAFGAAVYGIRSQGEFQRVAERSQALSAALNKLRQAGTEDAAPADLSLPSTTLGHAAEQAADIMLTEVLDWRIVFQARPLVLPG